MAPPGGETALDQSDAYPTYAHLSDNRGLYIGAPGGNKRMTNQNAPFQMSTNQKLTQNMHIFKDSDCSIYYSCAKKKEVQYLVYSHNNFRQLPLRIN